MIIPTTNSSPEETLASTPVYSRDERTALAGELFSRFHARCFWNSPADLEITEDRIAFVQKGLRQHGGREGFRLAGLLGAEVQGRSTAVLGA